MQFESACNFNLNLSKCDWLSETDRRCAGRRQGGRGAGHGIEKFGVKLLVLRNGEHNPIAVMDVEDIVGGIPEHPPIANLDITAKNMCISGRLHGFQMSPHYDMVAAK